MNILDEVKKPLTECRWKITSGVYHRGDIRSGFSEHRDAALEQAFEDQPLLIARIEALEAEHSELRTLFTYSIECLDAINNFMAMIPRGAATDGVRKILDEYVARIFPPDRA